jgi:Domain of unknown function (DUF6457)
MNQWLSAQAELLATQSGVDRASLELSPQDIETMLDLAGRAARESGERTNAPLFCYLLGLARANGASLEELDELVRSKS